MKNRLALSICLAIFASFSVAAQDNISVIEKNFKDIPWSQPTGVYWYWVSGNMSADGVVKDLQAMKKAGITRVQIGMIGEGQGAPQGPVRMFTEEWWNILHTMFKTAGDLGIEVGLFNCPGWSQSGGPWVKPSQSMRYLGSVKDTLTGPSLFKGKLPVVGENAQDVNVLAYPLIESESVFSVTGDPSRDSEVTFSSDKPASVRTIIVEPTSTPGSTDVELLVRKDGALKSLEKFYVDRSNAGVNVGFDPVAPVVISIPETSGEAFVVSIEKPGVIKKVTLSAVPAVERFAEKTFAKMWQTPHPMWDAYMWREQPTDEGGLVVNPSEVIDISEYMSADGTLSWKVPEGKWVVERTAMLPTGSMDSPAPEEGTGLETDKMSKRHIRTHFDSYLGKILERIPAEDRKTFKIVVEDSYETGGQNWTDDMIPDFKKAYGYDPTPYIPVLSGVVVGSRDISDRFLWDLRRLVADEVSYNYVGGLREVSNEHGLTTWLENYGHWGFPGEFLQYGGQSDEIAGEFWSFGDLAPELDYYTPILVANNDFLESDPDTARAFMAATAKGYEYAEENPEDAADMLIAGDNTGSLEGAGDLVHASQKYLSSVYSDNNTPWGWIDPDRWNAFYGWLYNNKLITKDLTGYGFTDDFLPEESGNAAAQTAAENTTE